MYWPTCPSAAILPAFLAARASPFLRRTLIASSVLPLASASAALHSIIPAPVISRSSLTCAAVISIFESPIGGSLAVAAVPVSSLARPKARRHRSRPCASERAGPPPRRRHGSRPPPWPAARALARQPSRP